MNKFIITATCAGEGFVLQKGNRQEQPGSAWPSACTIKDLIRTGRNKAVLWKPQNSSITPRKLSLVQEPWVFL